MAAALAAPAIFYRSDLLDAPLELDGTADLVYSGRGALCWLHNIAAWATVVYRLLKPGGILHVLDDHPVSLLFDAGADRLVPSGYDYFSSEVESNRGWPASYLSLDIADEQQSMIPNSFAIVARKPGTDASSAENARMPAASR
jgi:SAM-dependent methyltransferase